MIALDTNVVSGFLRGNLRELPKDKLYIPFVVLAELRAGVAAGKFNKRGYQALDSLLAEGYVTVSPGLTPETVPCYAQIYAYLKQRGTPVSPNDMWIAAECMLLALPILTLDKDFDSIPQIMRV
jgi:predicted nucleic acid-binding protein